MPKLTRRGFLREGALSAAAVSMAIPWTSSGYANPLNLPIGLQLYSVRKALPESFDGTLKQVGAMGYKEVEMAGFYSKTPAEILMSMHAAGLRVVSAHYGLDELRNDLSGKIDFAKQLGLQYMICPGTSFPHPQPRLPGQKAPVLTLDDWKWNADQFNMVGEQTRKAGIQFGYHNHYNEFKPVDGKVPYNQLFTWCDPQLVKFEIDVGWMVYAGLDPLDYMKKYPGRFPELHIKEVKIGTKPFADLHGGLPTTEVGRGAIDWKRIFAGARQAGVKHIFVEQEEFPDLPMMEALKADCDYLQSLKA
ncbi:MAG: sugar phosphate isomerase/epimerase [Terriglobia bacterium]|jgi:sugar phosphate isomerase/epimerase